ncbi:MAG TPA: ATP-binding protein [Candidatus Saccharimonadia bacterium]
MGNRAGRLEDSSVTVRAVIDSMGEGLIAIDDNGLITAVNPYAVEALGYQESELLGAWFPGAVVATDQHRNPIPSMSRPVVRALTSGEAVSELLHYIRKDGSLMPVFATVSPILVDGRPLGAIELFRDITKDKQLEIAKDEFVTLASHQLRTPASGVRAILSMLADGDFGELTDLQKRYLQKAIAGNDRQLQIIEDILNVARIDAGRMELELEPTDLTGLVRETLAEQAAEIKHRRQQVTFRSRKPLVVWADPRKLRMVVDNLVSNASKYTPLGGRIQVRVGRSGDFAVIDVQDTGVGIAKSDIPQLFTKFTRIDNELSASVGGSGLGLYLAHNIVTLHRGTISVQSRRHGGSAFRVVLPITRGQS